MKIPFFATIFLSLTTLFAGPPAASMRLEVKCPECPDSGRALLEAYRTALPVAGFEVVDTAAKAPSLRVYAYPEGKSWFLAPSLSSPRGTVISVSRDEFSSLTELLAAGVDSSVTLARRTVNEAVLRSKDAKPK
ncbi:MAG: hypothetical protein IPN71_08005 [Fibrobacteres bacterium]|jgi:hypothetical protein|nr:hypothetical protein [Fibrobacterota bacterium]